MHFRTDFFLEVHGQTLYGKAGDWVIHRLGSCVAHSPRSQRESFVNDWIFFSAEPEDETWLRQLPYNVPLPLSDENVFPRCISEILDEHIRSDHFSSQLVSDRIYQSKWPSCAVFLPALFFLPFKKRTGYAPANY